ncbi:MAG: hypothetical protein PUB17_02090 [Lachnospiraceae bacterium]|nr:hypothetical protein [Lachnospiraceae bacterium]
MTENELKDMLKSETRKLKEIDAFIKRNPGGVLRIQTRNGRRYYYLVDEHGVKYLPKKNYNRICDIAQHNYYKKVKKVLEDNIRAIEKFKTEYIPHAEQAVYAELSNERRELIYPYTPGILDRISKVENEDFCDAPYQEMRRYETEKGEKVRSKSEVIIANILNGYSDVLRYQYEKPLYLENDGTEVVVHPDFTIYNLITGKTIYWEHAGMMGDAVYASRFVNKYNLFISNGYIPGVNLILTFESEENPLNISNVYKIVSGFAETD